MQALVTQVPTLTGGAWRYLTPITPVHEAMSRHLILQAADSARAAMPVTVDPRDARASHALVIGAGRCREIPLRELLERFDRVTVTDIDPDTLQRGLDETKLTPEERRRVEVIIGDIVGVSEHLVRGIEACFAEGVWTLSACEHLVERMASFIESLEPNPAAMQPPYDLVVASCVLSQLHLASVNRVSRQFSQRFPETVKLDKQPRWRQAVCRLASRMQARFIDLVHDLVSDNGRLYLAATPRVHLIFRAPQGRWKTRETRDMLAHRHLHDFLDDRFVIEAQSQWQWSQPLPADPKKPGDLFDVEAMVLRKSRRESCRVGDFNRAEVF